MAEREWFSVEEVVRLVGISPRRVRYYERVGLVSPLSRGGGRLYSRAQVERLRRIGYLTARLGLDTKGLRAVLALLEVIEELEREVRRLRRLLDDLSAFEGFGEVLEGEAREAD